MGWSLVGLSSPLDREFSVRCHWKDGGLRVSEGTLMRRGLVRCGCRLIEQYPLDFKLISLRIRVALRGLPEIPQRRMNFRSRGPR